MTTSDLNPPRGTASGTTVATHRDGRQGQRPAIGVIWRLMLPPIVHSGTGFARLAVAKVGTSPRAPAPASALPRSTPHPQEES